MYDSKIIGYNSKQWAVVVTGVAIAFSIGYLLLRDDGLNISTRIESREQKAIPTLDSLISH